MTSGSFTGTSGSFNPASYTRHLIGSPLSFRSGSFGSRFYPGVSPGQLLGPLDPTDFKFGKVSSSVESDRGSILNAFTIQDREDELCRNYTCCGLNLTDLHALLEHFEECHVVVVDPYHPQPQLQVQTSQNNPPQNVDLTTAVEAAAQNANNMNNNQYVVQPAPASTMLQIPQGYHNGLFDPDDMEMDMENASAPSSGAPSPPDTPISTPLSSYPSPSMASSGHAFPHPQVYSSPASTSNSACPSPISAFDTTTVLSSRSSLLSVSTFPATRDMLNNGYNGYNGDAFSASGMVSEGVDSAPQTPLSPESCVPPALLFSASSTPVTTPNGSRVNSPAPNSYFPQASTSGSSSLNPNKASSSAAARASTTLSRPSSSLLLSKPFKCPKPNCNKSYKQANGLKYHMTHGSCSFGPAKELGEVQAVLKEREREGSEGEPLTEREMMEIEREAERRLRPFACGVGDCQRRYKNMNGLRYHYQHSGDHGAIGLALLASGQHECLRNAHGRRDGSRDRNANNAAAQQQRQSQTTFPSNPQPQTSTTQYAQQQQQQQPQQPTFATAYTVQPTQSQQHQPHQQPQQWSTPMMVYNVQMQPQAQPQHQGYSS